HHTITAALAHCDQVCKLYVTEGQQTGNNHVKEPEYGYFILVHHVLRTLVKSRAQDKVIAEVVQALLSFNTLLLIYPTIVPPSSRFWEEILGFGTLLEGIKDHYDIQFVEDVARNYKNFYEDIERVYLDLQRIAIRMVSENPFDTSYHIPQPIMQ